MMKWMVFAWTAAAALAASAAPVLTDFESDAMAARVLGRGVPGSEYSLEWSKALSGTNLHWYKLDSMQADPVGTFGLKDTRSEHNRGRTGFYRVREEVSYLVVDMSQGALASHWPVTNLTAVPAGGWTDEYKTGKLVLRRIPAGSFTMGSPEGELGSLGETQHLVHLTEDFYVGVFEVTQRQWELATGYRPSFFKNGEFYKTRPVEQVSWADICGSEAGAAWPADGPHEVDPGSFLYALRRQTGLNFDLPTEAQWEYACRAGTTNALNSGKDLTSIKDCPNMDEVGRYGYNRGTDNTETCDTSGGTAAVGSYKPNAWGLHDMHGNVSEWCLDWPAEYGEEAEMDPPGASEGTQRTLRGGCWNYGALRCRSAARNSAIPSGASSPKTTGLRLVCPVQ
jgi:formylglycine-generating enzyme required for sulfatase activity